MASKFKCGFEMANYEDVCPSFNEYMEDDFLLNAETFKGGNADDCYWKKYSPSVAESLSLEYQRTEIKRIYKTGVWIIIKDEIVWIPPQYYFALQYGMAGGGNLEFRLKRLKHVYEKIRARNNPNCIGTLTIKGRGDGETTMAINDAMWELKDDGKILGLANVGIQSKTREDAINPCWQTAQLYWQSYPKWIKDYLFADFDSGDSIEQKMKFKRDMIPARMDGDYQIPEVPARNITFKYYPCVYNAMDGRHNMIRCILDEVCKWKEAEFYDTFINYSRFINPGFKRKGVFDMFSSPADTPTKSNEQVAELYKNSNPNEIDPLTGTTKSKVYRIYSNPLDGIENSYDKFGDADPNRIYDLIMAERKRTPKDKLLGVIRANPLNEAEMFESTETNGFSWGNREGIKKRRDYLERTKFKDSENKEPIVIYGNLEWKNGEVDTDVVFRQSDSETFNEYDARFGFSYLPQNKEELKYSNVYLEGINLGARPMPPSYVESCLGIDPYAKRYRTGDSNSKGAMVNHKFRDAFNTGIVRCPTMLYIERPHHADIFHEDAIKAAVFNRALVQPESITDKIIDYFQDRGYMDWMLNKIGSKRNSNQKGDAPANGGRLMGEITGLMDAITNLPIEEFDDYPLMRNWFYELLDDISKFNPKDTHKNDAMMAWGQALLGSMKIMKLKPKVDSKITEGVLKFLIGR